MTEIIAKYSLLNGKKGEFWRIELFSRIGTWCFTTPHDPLTPIGLAYEEHLRLLDIRAKQDGVKK